MYSLEQILVSIEMFIAREHSYFNSHKMNAGWGYICNFPVAQVIPNKRILKFNPLINDFFNQIEIIGGLDVSCLLINRHIYMDLITNKIFRMCFRVNSVLNWKR